MFLGDLRLMCKDWRTAVDASDGGLRRWELRARLFQTPRLPTAAASVEALDLRGLFPHSEIGPPFPRLGCADVRALQRLPAVFPVLQSLTLHPLDMNGCVQEEPRVLEPFVKLRMSVSHGIL